MDELQKKIVDYVEANGKTYQQIALEIHEKPEVSNYEFFASKRLADQIKSVGFEVEMPAAGHRTGFAASYKSGKPRSGHGFPCGVRCPCRTWTWLWT